MTRFGMGHNYEKAEGGRSSKARVNAEDTFDHLTDDHSDYFSVWHSTYGTIRRENITETFVTDEYIEATVPFVVNRSWDKVPWNFSEWQKSELFGLDAKGTTCLLKSWLLMEGNLPRGKYCNTSWDKMFCWPPTPSGTLATPSCSEVWESQGTDNLAYEIDGFAMRVCSENGTWLKSNFTNCIDSFNGCLENQEKDEELAHTVIQHLLYVVPIISTVCLCVALLVFWYFRRCIWCERVTLHTQLMLSLLLRSLMLFVITEPNIITRDKNYKKADFICKVILSIDLYAVVSSINWMFLQRIYLNGRWTISILTCVDPFKAYFAIGWFVPMILILMFVGLLQICQPISCWAQFTDIDEIHLFLGPMVLALAANLLFLSKIVRIMITRSLHRNGISEGMITRQAIRSTLLLFPLVGINNLVFLHNPTGRWNQGFVMCHTICGSSQGIFVSIIYCFTKREVRSAIYNEIRRICEEIRIKFQWPALTVGKTMETTSPSQLPPQLQRPQQLDTIVQQVGKKSYQIQIEIHSPPPLSTPRQTIRTFPSLDTIDENFPVDSTGTHAENTLIRHNEQQVEHEQNEQTTQEAELEQFQLPTRVLLETLI